MVGYEIERIYKVDLSILVLAIYELKFSSNTMDPSVIINDIISGLPIYAKYTVEPDRRAAIKEAVLRARHGDIVLISGKGHEDYQEIKGVRYPFSDAVELGKLLEELK